MIKQINPPALLNISTASVAVSFDLDLVACRDQHMLELPPHLERAVPKRQAEFLAGRYCAREALRRLGLGNVGILEARPDRSPQWPPDAIGSITHTTRFAWAAATREPKCGGIGIDSETLPPHEMVADVRSMICTTTDMHTLAQEIAPRWGEAVAVCLALSARESFYKSLAECDADKPEPDDVALVAIDTSAGRFHLEIQRRLSRRFAIGHIVDGRFTLAPPLVHTAIEW